MSKTTNHMPLPAEISAIRSKAQLAKLIANTVCRTGYNRTFPALWADAMVDGVKLDGSPETTAYLTRELSR